MILSMGNYALKAV